MNGWQIALLIGLLGAILSVLLTISRQIERFINVMLDLERRRARPDDSNLRFELSVFLKEANKAHHAETKRSVDEFLDRMTPPKP